jgi:hypothetical protein
MPLDLGQGRGARGRRAGGCVVQGWRRWGARRRRVRRRRRARGRAGARAGLEGELGFSFRFLSWLASAVAFSCKYCKQHDHLKKTIWARAEKLGKLVDTSFSPLHVNGLLGRFSVGRILRLLLGFYCGVPISLSRSPKEVTLRKLQV